GEVRDVRQVPDEHEDEEQPDPDGERPVLPRDPVERRLRGDERLEWAFDDRRHQAGTSSGCPAALVSAIPRVCSAPALTSWRSTARRTISYVITTARMITPSMIR